jgi:predicted membrane protein
MKHHQGRIFWGLFLIVLGILFLLDQMGRIDFGDVVSDYWPVIFILIGISILINSRFQSVGSAAFFILFGVFFLLQELDVFGRDVWSYVWPLAIIAVGVWLVAGFALSTPQKKGPEITVDELRISTVFSGQKRTIESQNFRGGRAEVVLGSLELDFTRAGLAGGQATLELSAVLGGIEIRVPREWEIVIQGSPVLGGIEDKKRSVPGAEKKGTLFIKATAVLAGIEIKD